MSKIVVVEGPRLSGKTRVCEHLMQQNLLPELFKDQCFAMSKDFDIPVTSPEIFEAFIKGKDACFVQMLDRTEGSLLLDRFFMTSCVLSSVFRPFPIEFGIDNFYAMDKIIDSRFPEMKRRLSYIVLDIQDPAQALADGIKGREGKDGLEDNMELIQKQIDNYNLFSELFIEHGYKVARVETYHTNPEVLEHAALFASETPLCDLQVEIY